MQPLDVFRQHFDTAVQTLEQWAGRQRDVAEVVVERAAGFWRVSLLPLSPTACAIELILHRNQTYDIMIGGESYEGLAVASLDDFEPLLAAIVDGRVRTRYDHRGATNALAGVMTEVMIDGGKVWQQARVVGSVATRAQTDPSVISRERHYAPYRRAAS